MNLNKSYTPKFNIVGFDNYYITDFGEVVNKKTNRFVKLSRDRAWYYYTLVDVNGKGCKVGLNKIVKTPYFSDSSSNLASKIKLSDSDIELSRSLGFID